MAPLPRALRAWRLCCFECRLGLRGTRLFIAQSYVPSRVLSDACGLVDDRCPVQAPAWVSGELGTGRGLCHAPLCVVSGGREKRTAQPSFYLFSCGALVSAVPLIAAFYAPPEAPPARRLSGGVNADDDDASDSEYLAKLGPSDAEEDQASLGHEGYRADIPCGWGCSLPFVSSAHTRTHTQHTHTHTHTHNHPPTHKLPIHTGVRG